MCWLSNLFKSGNPSGDIPSPRNKFDLDFLSTKYTLTTVQNTNSMEPLLDVGHTIILSNLPEHLGNLKAGDIIVWEQTRGEIIHSIIEVGSDNLGVYYKTQGLNVNKPDPEKIRKLDIKYVALGVLWTEGTEPFKEKIGD